MRVLRFLELQDNTSERDVKELDLEGKVPAPLKASPIGLGGWAGCANARMSLKERHHLIDDEPCERHSPLFQRNPVCR